MVAVASVRGGVRGGDGRSKDTSAVVVVVMVVLAGWGISLRIWDRVSISSASSSCLGWLAGGTSVLVGLEESLLEGGELWGGGGGAEEEDSLRSDERA